MGLFLGLRCFAQEIGTEAGNRSWGLFRWSWEHSYGSVCGIMLDV